MVGDELVGWDAFVHATGVRPHGTFPARRRAPPALARRRARARGRADALEPRGRRRRRVHRRARSPRPSRRSVGSVTVVEPAAAPLERVLGREVGGLLAARYAAHGVDLRLGVGVEGFVGGDRVRAVRLTDGDAAARRRRRGRDRDGRRDDRGRRVRPHLGSRCLRCGDIASWFRPSLGRHVRVEHWTSAAGQARTVSGSDHGRAHALRRDAVLLVGSVRAAAAARRPCREWHAVVLDGGEDEFTARYVDAERPAALRPRREPRVRAAHAALGARRMKWVFGRDARDTRGDGGDQRPAAGLRRQRERPRRPPQPRRVPAAPAHVHRDRRTPTETTVAPRTLRRSAADVVADRRQPRPCRLQRSQRHRAAGHQREPDQAALGARDPACGVRAPNRRTQTGAALPGGRQRERRRRTGTGRSSPSARCGRTVRAGPAKTRPTPLPSSATVEPTTSGAIPRRDGRGGPSAR